MINSVLPKKPLTARQLLLIITLIILHTLQPVFGSISGKKTPVFAADTIYKLSTHQIKKGERLFYGLIPLSDIAPTCADCHYTSYIDTLNWNPSAFDIANKYVNKKLEDLISVINEPDGKVMVKVHEGYNLDLEQAILLKGYLTELYEQGGPETKKYIDNLLLFILINIIGLLAIIDLLFLHKINFKPLHLLIILGATTYILKTMVVEGIAVGRQVNYAPAQPIKFSHAVHAGTNQTDCQYCHNLAERSKNSGIPEVGVCMNCHTVVTEGTNSGKFEINKILEAYRNKTPIEWIRIHNLPDYVFFSHAQHVAVGKLECQECHGPVETMDVVKQYPDLSMGWCLDCHRTRAVQFESNEYYALFEKYHEQIKLGEIDSVLVDDIGGSNCMKCHY